MVMDTRVQGSNRFDMIVALWRYNLMLLEAKVGRHVSMKEIVLEFDGSDREGHRLSEF